MNLIARPDSNRGLNIVDPIRSLKTLCKRVYPIDYSIVLMLQNSKGLPITGSCPIRVSRTAASVETVRTYLEPNIRELMFLFWTHHNVEFSIYNFKDITSMKDLLYGSEPLVGINSCSYLYYDSEIPMEFPATLSARLNSSVITPIWNVLTGNRLGSADEILAIENKNADSNL